MLDHMTRFLAFESAVDAEEIVRRHAARVVDLQPSDEYAVNFLGVSIDPAIFPVMLTQQVGQVEAIPIPANWHADVAEWASVLRAIDLAGPRFSILELGCAWGCWMCSAGRAALLSGREVQLIGVEGDDRFLQLAHRQMLLNGFHPGEYTLHRGIAAAAAGRALFPRQQDGAVGFGSAPLFGVSPEVEAAAVAAGSHDVLDMLPLSEILAPCQRLDLLHIDIQGGEADLIIDSFSTIAEKVAYVFVGTHSRALEARIMEAMLAGGFILEFERAAIYTLSTDQRPNLAYDGVQGWRNSRFPLPA